MSPINRRKLLTALLAWAMAIAVACVLDAPVASWVRGSGLEDYFHKHPHLRNTLNVAGQFKFTVVLLAVLVVLRRVDWRGAVFALIACLVSGSHGALKWIVGRSRPFKIFDADGTPVLAPFQLDFFRGGLPGMFHQTNLSFPSGHATWAFASAAALSILLPRWRWAFYAVAAVVALERIAENAHWTSDVVCAAAFGVGCARLLQWLWWDAWAHARLNEGSHGREAVPVAGDTGLQRAGEHSHSSSAG